MDTNLKHARISVSLHAIAGVIAGMLSFMLNNPAYAGLLGLGILVGLGFGIERVTGKRGFKWWFGHGIFIYLLLWLVSWTYFFNS